MIAQVNVTLSATPPSSYTIWIDSKLLENITSWMPKNKSNIVIITDNIVKKHYAASFDKTLKKHGYKTLLLSFPAGEKSKNNLTKSQLEEKMLAHGCDRDSLILALGGGVVGDLAGFIAATYMRGIAYIQIPTTLLAMLDSSVGGKTGIDTPQGKNLIGAFWQPIAVISDLQCLKTLPQKQMINGLIEAIKMFLTSDVHSLNYLKENLNAIFTNDEVILSQIIARAIKIKANIVTLDERESHQRAILNFGHTIGHALEQLTNYELLHGYAVALGILVEAQIAHSMGLLDKQHVVLIKNLFGQLNIKPCELSQFNVKQVIQCTQLDKKKRAGCVHYVLLNDLGCVYHTDDQFSHPVSDHLVQQAFLDIQKDD